MSKQQDMKASSQQITIAGYGEVLTDVTELLEMARRTAARATNAVMTVTYWEIGRRIVKCEQGGKERAGYGQALLVRLSNDLKSRFGRGFGVDNLELFRAFYIAYPQDQSAFVQEKNSESSIRILPLARDAKQNSESLFRNFSRSQILEIFPLPWTHYARLIRRTRSPEFCRLSFPRSCVGMQLVTRKQSRQAGVGADLRVVFWGCGGSGFA